jgi:CPA2 family monovalent cation:H+ antiporter-2
MVGRLLASENVPFVALETNDELVEEGHKDGKPVYFGDATRREILERAGFRNARAFVVTLNSPRGTERMVRAILQLKPGACVLARARDTRHAERLARIGVTDAVPETIEASLQLGGRLLLALGVPDDAVDRRLDLAREAELERIAGTNRSPEEKDAQKKALPYEDVQT